MVRLVRWMAMALLALILMTFAVSNREPTVINLWPLPVTLEARLYLVVLLPLLLGFLLGELAAWINGRHWRREARLRARRIEALERELAATQARLPSSQTPLPPLT